MYKVYTVMRVVGPLINRQRCDRSSEGKQKIRNKDTFPGVNRLRCTKFIQSCEFWVPPSTNNDAIGTTRSLFNEAGVKRLPCKKAIQPRGCRYVAGVKGLYSHPVVTTTPV